MASVIVTGVATPKGRLDDLIKSLERSGIKPVQVASNNEGGFRFLVEIPPSDIPGFRGVIDFHSRSWELPSMIDTMRTQGGEDIMRFTVAEQELIDRELLDVRSSAGARARCTL